MQTVGGVAPETRWPATTSVTRDGATPLGPWQKRLRSSWTGGKDPETGRVTVRPKEALAVDHLFVEAVQLYRDAEVVDRVKLRYRSEPVACTVAKKLQAGRYPRIEIMLNEPFMAAAPGQVACFMSGDRVVGHGLIARKEIADAA